MHQFTFAFPELQTDPNGTTRPTDYDRDITKCSVFKTLKIPQDERDGPKEMVLQGWKPGLIDSVDASNRHIFDNSVSTRLGGLLAARWSFRSCLALYLSRSRFGQLKWQCTIDMHDSDPGGWAWLGTGRDVIPRSLESAVLIPKPRMSLHKQTAFDTARPR